MSRRLLFLAGVLACGVAWLLFAVYQRPSMEPAASTGSNPAVNSTASTAPPADTRPAEEIAQEQAAYDRQTQTRIAELAKLEAQHQRQTDAEENTRQHRASLQAAKAAAWATIIATNLPAYYALRAKAASSPSKKAACTFCDGHGSLEFCILCDNSGKCPTCGGAGKTHFQEACPTCRGTGKCFLCLGSGRMACPFCDDGIIYLNLPVPSAQMPLQAIGLSRLPNPNYRPHGVAESSRPAPPPSPENAQPAGPPPSTRRFAVFYQLLAAAAFFLLLAVALPKVVPAAGRFLNGQSDGSPGKVARQTQVLDARIADFVSTLQTTLSSSPGRRLLNQAWTEPGGSSSSSRDGLARFYQMIPERLNAIRQLFAVVSRPLDDDSRKRILLDLSLEVRGLRSIAEAPELRAIWQVATALEALLRQLAEKVSQTTPSNTRTIAAAVVLLEALSGRDVKSERLLHRAVRFLAVDDDPVIRQVISTSLNRIFNPPELAADGSAALELAAKNVYDLIFLDVEMPGMDGFEVCAKIREGSPNAATPIVFVTGHSDFDSRVKAADSGGHDLIAKPFFSFEIVLKALTLVLRSRLHDPSKAQISPLAAPKPLNEGRASNDVNAVPRATDAACPPSAETPQKSTAATPTPAAPRLGEAEAAHPPAQKAALNGHAATVPSSSVPSIDQAAAAFFAGAEAQIPSLRSMLKALASSESAEARQDLLSDFYVVIDALVADAEHARLPSSVRLCSALQGLFRKLLESPDAFAPHLLDSADAALDILATLCGIRLDPDLSAPPASIMVVDDDPVCCRACSSALQLTFARPHLVPSGEAAVVLAEQRDFDVIFMDVQMTGMDGFAACAKIHQIPRNTAVPVVFVTSHTDLKSRQQAEAAGGVGFIAKPAMPVEITLTALTFALRTRLGQTRNTRAIQELAQSR